MKIVHIAPNAPYNEGWSYQENILPKYQMKLGHEVILVITNMQHQDGMQKEVECTDSITKDGFRVIRMKPRSVSFPVVNRVLTKLDVYDTLCKERPDFIFHHGLVSATILQVCKYKKRMNPNCVIVQDNHMDYNIGFKLGSIKHIAIKQIYSALFGITKKYITKVYGVTPWRQTYSQEIFGVPKEMSDVLIMGADDEKIDFEHRVEIRHEIRNRFQIADDEFLIVTGAKIDMKKKIHLLMKAVNQMAGVRLLVFGNVLDDIRDEFDKQLSDKVQWAGFIPSDEAYNYFLAADLVMFPGQHSVLWEQACACKVPCVFARWEGMDHVDNGGNARFIDDISVDGLKDCITNLLKTPEYYEMLKCANSEITDIFLYSNIARKSLECMDEVKNA